MLGRFLNLFLALLVSAMAYTDILTRGNSAPVDVIDVSLEATTPDVVAMRRVAEQRRAESAILAALSVQRSQAEAGLESLIAAEKLHAAAVDDILG